MSKEIKSRFEDENWLAFIADKNQFIDKIGETVDPSSIDEMQELPQKVLVTIDLISMDDDTVTVNPYTQKGLKELIELPDEAWYEDTAIVNWLKQLLPLASVKDGSYPVTLMVNDPAFGDIEF